MCLLYHLYTFAKAMLDVADDLERALNVVTPEDLAKTTDPKLTSIVEGITMTDKNLHKIFFKFGVVSFGKVGV
jgi:molecular chaperone GrpE (heat shock protein)